MAFAVRQLQPTDLSRSDVHAVLKASIFRPTPQRIRNYEQRLASKDAGTLAAFSDDRIVGILGFEQAHEAHRTIITIYVDPDARRLGVGRGLVWDLIQQDEHGAVEAETDDDAVEFYHSMGFAIERFGEKYPGVERYRCVYNDSHWQACPPGEVVSALRSAGVESWVSGGWAIDLYLGRQTRSHEDTDICIRRTDQCAARAALGGESFATHAPGLRLVSPDDYLDTVPNTWQRTAADSAWRVDLQMIDVEESTWIYRRLRSIREPIADLGFVSDDGLPCIRPEVLLLYKGGGSSVRPKDEKDFEEVLPTLDPQRREWLAEALASEFPGGHQWVDRLHQS